MFISEAIIRLVKYPPELIPDSWLGQVPASAEVAPPVLDLRRLTPYITALANIQLAPNAAVILRARYDTSRVEENTEAMLSTIPLAPVPAWVAGVLPLPGAWRLPAKDILYYNLAGTVAGPVPDYTTHYGVWAFPPTVAHKLLYAITLTREEREIAERLGISNTVEKGLLPLPISSQIEREYRIMGEETHSRSINIAVFGTTYTIESLYPKLDEFIVLTRVAAEPGTALQDVRLIIDRDDDANYAQLHAFAMSLVAGGEVECFIPAMKEIRLTTISTVAPATHLFRYTFKRVKMSNLLRVRFGLVSKDEVPGDTWDKVQGGIL